MNKLLTILSCLAVAVMSISALQAQSVIDPLVAQFEATSDRAGRLAVANRIFRLLNDEEVTDSLIQYTKDTPADTVAAQLYYWLGEQQFYAQRYAEATELYDKALPHIGAQDLTMMCDCYNELSICHARGGLFSQGIYAAARSLEYAEQMGDPARMVTATNTIGCLYMMAKQSAEGEKYLQRSLQIATELNDSVKMAVRYGTLSELYHTLGSDTTAVAYAREALRLDSLRSDSARMAVRRVQLASPLFAMGDISAAEAQLTAARPVLEASGNRVSLAICMNQLGYIELRRQRWNLAAEWCGQALELYTFTGDRYGRAKALWGLAEALGHSDAAASARYMRTYAELKDSLYQQDVAQMTADYDARYQNAELRIQNEHERQHNRMVRLIGGIVIVVLLGGVVALLYILRLKTKNIQMKQQLDKVRDQLLTPSDRDFLERVDKQLEQQLEARDVDLERLASELFISRTQLNRRVKALTDETMRDRVNRLRAERAKQLLATDNQTIGEVARACGFDDTAYFSRFFRKMTGQSPTDYKKSLNLTA